jgi:hypothetical protein
VKVCRLVVPCDLTPFPSPLQHTRGGAARFDVLQADERIRSRNQRRELGFAISVLGAFCKKLFVFAGFFIAFIASLFSIVGGAAGGFCSIPSAGPPPPQPAVTHAKATAQILQRIWFRISNPKPFSTTPLRFSGEFAWMGDIESFNPLISQDLCQTAWLQAPSFAFSAYATTCCYRTACAT